MSLYSCRLELLWKGRFNREQNYEYVDSMKKKKKEDKKMHPKSFWSAQEGTDQYHATPV